MYIVLHLFTQIKNDLNILPADDIEAFLNSGAALFIDMGNMNSDTLCGIANKTVFDQLDFAKVYKEITKIKTKLKSKI